MTNSPGGNSARDGDIERLLEKREGELADARGRIRQLEAALDLRSAEAAALRRIGEATGHIVNTDEILPLIAEIATQVTGTESAQVYLFNDARDRLILRAATEADALGDRLGKIHLQVGEGITGWVAREKQHVAISAEAWNDDRFQFVPELNEERYQSMLSVPLMWRGDVIGVINVRTMAPHDYTMTQVQLLSSIASQLAGAVTASRRFRSAKTRLPPFHGRRGFADDYLEPLSRGNSSACGRGYGADDELQSRRAVFGGRRQTGVGP